MTLGVKYYVKAFAINLQGTAFGKETFFTTQVNFPIVRTTPADEITLNSAVLGGEVEDNGGFEVTERGIYWAEIENVAINGNKIVLGNGNG